MGICIRVGRRVLIGIPWDLIGGRLLLGLWGFGLSCVCSSFPPNPFREDKTDLGIAGFIRRIQVTANGNGWDHVYDLSYFFGFFVSGFTHWILHTFFPTEKQRGSSPFEMDLHRSSAVEGQAPMGYRGSLESGSKEVVKSDV